MSESAGAADSPLPLPLSPLLQLCAVGWVAMVMNQMMGWCLVVGDDGEVLISQWLFNGD